MILSFEALLQAHFEGPSWLPKGAILIQVGVRSKLSGGYPGAPEGVPKGVWGLSIMILAFVVLLQAHFEAILGATRAFLGTHLKVSPTGAFRSHFQMPLGVFRKSPCKRIRQGRPSSQILNAPGSGPVRAQHMRRHSYH